MIEHNSLPTWGEILSFTRENSAREQLNRALEEAKIQTDEMPTKEQLQMIRELLGDTDSSASKIVLQYLVFFAE